MNKWTKNSKAEKLQDSGEEEEEQKQTKSCSLLEFIAWWASSLASSHFSSSSWAPYINGGSATSQMPKTCAQKVHRRTCKTNGRWWFITVCLAAQCWKGRTVCDLWKTDRHTLLWKALKGCPWTCGRHRHRHRQVVVVVSTSSWIHTQLQSNAAKRPLLKWITHDDENSLARDYRRRLLSQFKLRLAERGKTNTTEKEEKGRAQKRGDECTI